MEVSFFRFLVCSPPPATEWYLSSFDASWIKQHSIVSMCWLGQ